MNSFNKLFKFSFIFILFFSFPIHSATPRDGFIKGKVIDKKTQEPLPGVNVFIEHTTVGAATNENGIFRIDKAPVGKFHLIASIIGYNIGHKAITIKSKEETNIDFELEEGLVEMGTIVVTGTATPHIYTDTPVKTEVVPRKLIEQKFAVNLAEALDLQNGVRVENNCQNCNFTQIRINGLEGKYTEILVDGDPVISTLAGVYGLEQIPEEMIQQIEIVKGGGSALYGGGAVGGVINVITSRPILNKTRVRYLMNSTDGEPDQRIGFISELANKNETAGAYVFASTRNREPYDYNEDGFSELGELKNESLGFKWYYMPSRNTEITSQLHRIHETRRGGNMFDKPYHEAQIAEAIETWRWGGTLRWQHRLNALFDYRFFYSFANTRRNSFYGGLGDDQGWDSEENRLSNLAAYGRSTNPLHIAGTQFNYRLAGNLFTGGVQYKTDKLDDNSVMNEKYHISETFTNLGVFLQDNLHFLQDDALEFVIGGRIDKHSELDNVVFSPRVNSKFNISSSLALHAAFTTGFKAPQVFNEDLHIEAIDGKQRVVRNSEDLSEETSMSISGGIDYQSSNGNMPLLVSISGFFTKLDDAFALEADTENEDAELINLTRINTDGAKVMGVETNFAARMAAGLELRGGFTYKLSEYDSEYEAVEGVSTKDFMRTPDVYGNVSLTYDLTRAFTLTTALNYTGSASVPNEEPAEGDPYIKKSDSFIEFDAGISYVLPFFSELSPKFSLGVKNMLNAYQDDLEKGAARNPAYLYGPSLPRTIFLGLETEF